MLERKKTVNANNNRLDSFVPRRMRGNVNEAFVNRFCANRPWPSPGCRPFAWDALLFTWSEEPHLAAGGKCFCGGVVVAAFAGNVVGEVYAGVVGGLVDAAAQLEYVLALRRRFVRSDLWIGISKDEVKRLGDITTENNLVRREAGGTINRSAESKERLREHVLPVGQVPVAKAPEALAEVVVHTFDLGIALGVVAGGVRDAVAEELANVTSEIRSKVRSHVGVDDVRDPVAAEDLTLEDPDRVLGGGDPKGKRFVPFRKRALDTQKPHGFRTRARWQAADVVDVDLLPRVARRVGDERVALRLRFRSAGLAGRAGVDDGLSFCSQVWKEAGFLQTRGSSPRTFVGRNLVCSKDGIVPE